MFDKKTFESGSEQEVKQFAACCKLSGVLPLAEHKE